jgi:hypothetical protein
MYNVVNAASRYLTLKAAVIHAHWIYTANIRNTNCCRMDKEWGTEWGIE